MKNYVHDELGWTAEYVPSSNTYRISSGPTFLGNLQPHAISTMPNWKQVDKVLFTSEDGKQIVDGDDYFIVDHSFAIIPVKATLDNIYAKGILRFDS